ncbi:VOC family protein [Roseobacter sp.]|uniref:VOC family protein n=1 Tax=Roseobacter sp. TaxID=1907202 RepID=UPI00385C8400
MKIERLDHVNIRTNNLDAMIAWYARVLGLEAGARPDFGFRGAWIYVGEHPAVHLVEVTEECASIAPKIEHFAFSASGYADFLQGLEDNGVASNVARVPGLPLVQVNIVDPDGNHIHVDFSTEETVETPSL